VLENLVPWRTTLSTASKKSRSDATFLLARMANIPAYKRDLTQTQEWGWTNISYFRSHRPQLSTCCIWTEASYKVKANVPLNAHATEDKHGGRLIQYKLTYLRAWIFRIWARPSASGNENSTRLSRRPGRRRAGSRVSGLMYCELQYYIIVKTCLTDLWPWEL
jgi:hypothetical protein